MCRCSQAPWAPRLELADILRTHGPAYLASHALVPVQAQALRDIMACRTAALGGHLYRCDRCGFEQPHFNSCRNTQTSRQYIGQVLLVGWKWLPPTLVLSSE